MSLFKNNNRVEVYDDSYALTEADYVEIRAHQRTFEGAYWRTSLAVFAFSLIVLRVFEKKFYKIGILLVIFGLFVLYVSMLRRKNNSYIFDKEKPFVTAGDYVALMGGLAIVIYSFILLLVIYL